MKEIIAELEEQRSYLIMEFGACFDDDELYKLSGRLYQLHLIIEKLNSHIEKDD